MKKIILTFLLILGLSSITFAQTQAELNEKARKDFLKADKELNIVYNKILKEYKTDTIFIKNLKIAQKLWLKLRDAELQAKYPDVQHRMYGSVLPMCGSMYLQELTEERIKRLKIWLDGIEEGDVCSGSVKIKNQ